MSGSLIKIDEEIVTSAVSSVTLTGIDSTYDVYMLKINKVVPETDGNDYKLRVTESGTPNTTANYDRAFQTFRTDIDFQNVNGTNETELDLSTSIGNAGSEQANAIMYIFGANNSSDNTFFTNEELQLGTTGLFIGLQGGGVFKSQSQVDGVQILCQAGSTNFSSGTFTLYGLKK
jgi:hypothetical protein